VRDFYGSGPRSRHYVLDRPTGTIRFGDGVRGLAPPQGRDNVVARLYRTGGGEGGNRAAGTVTKLTTTIPYVAGARNYEAAAGGTAPEQLDRARERGPRLLRHGGRAVVAVDFEDVALDASPAVARARAFPVRGSEDHGRVAVVVVPHSEGNRPAPTLELLNEVEDFLRARTSPVFDLRVVGPGWLRVSVSAEVVPRSLDQATDVESRIRRALDEFLHPLRGGFGAAGWPFGRRPHRSDVYALIERLDGVDHVRSLEVDERMEEAGAYEEAFLPYSGVHEVAMSGGE
jgi:predicted phage baseplate assembly protein